MAPATTASSGSCRSTRRPAATPHTARRRPSPPGARPGAPRRGSPPSPRPPTSAAAHRQAAYFTTRREPRLVSQEQKRRGAISSYIGSEGFLSLVVSNQAPDPLDLRNGSLAG